MLLGEWRRGGSASGVTRKLYKNGLKAESTAANQCPREATAGQMKCCGALENTYDEAVKIEQETGTSERRGRLTPKSPCEDHGSCPVGSGRSHWADLIDVRVRPNRHSSNDNAHWRLISVMNTRPPMNTRVCCR